MTSSLRLRRPVQLVVNVIFGRTRLLHLGLRVRVIRIPGNRNCLCVVLRRRLGGSVYLLRVEVCIGILRGWCKGHCALAWGAWPGLTLRCVERLRVRGDCAGTLDGCLEGEGICVG
jgi:hypothetical protein